MVSTDHKQHKKLESHIIGRFCNAGYITTELTYHNHCDPITKNILASIQSPTSWLIRTRSDRISVCEKTSHIVKWDAKTCSWLVNQDFAIEFTPFFSMLSDERMGGNSLFFMQREDTTEYVFSPSVLVNCIQRIIIPTWKYPDTKPVKQYIENVLQVFDIKTTVMESDNIRPGRSGDPFGAFYVDNHERWDFDRFFLSINANQNKDPEEEVRPALG